MKFKIEQVALCPNPERIKEAAALLAAIGIDFPVNDIVRATGEVFGEPASNQARLAFNYDAITGNELELLHYTHGKNWMDIGLPRVSHLGMHCSEEELEWWRALMKNLKIEIAQEVNTTAHTNPVIMDSRRYQYVIFDTYELIGVDLKFIVRKPVPQE